MVGTAAVLAAAGGAPLLVVVPAVAIGVPLAVRAFVALVPSGTVRLVQGIPAAIAVRGILTFAFFGTDAYVSLTFKEVRDQRTFVAGLALTACTIAWTGAAWVQQRFIGTVGPRRLVMAGFGLVVLGIAGMLGSLGSWPIPVGVLAWGVGGAGIGLAYAPLAVTVLGLAEPGHEGSAAASLQLTDVLGTSLGAGVGGALVAFGDGHDWALRSALEVAFVACLVVAGLGIAAARRLPTTLPET
jgi:MFS family permease